MQDPDAARYLVGVQELALDVSIGRENAFPHERMTKSMTRANFVAVPHCPAKGCHGGGYELARDLYERAISRQEQTVRGGLRCRGYRDVGRGRRQSCDYTLWYAARIVYGARHY